jgi:hypothetical protein
MQAKPATSSCDEHAWQRVHDAVSLWHVNGWE